MDARYEERNAFNFRMKEIYNFNTNRVEQADYWISQGEEKLFVFRTSLQKNKKNYGCPVCKTPVLLSRSKKGNWFFRHQQRGIGVKCALVDEHLSPSDKRIQLYNVAKESEEHKEMKKFLEKFLLKDSFVKGVPLVEKIVKGQYTPTKWKKPDVQCCYNNWDFVFELQISNTWLSDIVARDTFYAAEKKVIFWIFNEFDSCKPNEQMTQADIFYNNPHVNLFVLDTLAREHSYKTGKLHLHCYYRLPKVNYTREIVESNWHDKLVTLDQLKIDSVLYKPYYVSYHDKLMMANSILDDWLKQKEHKKKKEIEDRLRREKENRLRQEEEQKRQREELEIRDLREKQEKEKREAEFQAWLKAEKIAKEQAKKEQKKALINEILSLKPSYTLEYLDDLSLFELKKLSIDLDEEEKAEEKRILALKNLQEKYHYLKDALTYDYSRGQFCSADGKTILRKQMMEYCLNLINSVDQSLEIAFEDLQKFGYAIANEFGQSGSEYFIKFGLASTAYDRWELVRQYRHNYLKKASENFIDIREFWRFCFLVGNPNCLDEGNVEQVA